VHAGDGRVDILVGIDFLPTESPLNLRCVRLVHQQDELHLLAGVAILLDERLPVAQVIEAGAYSYINYQENMYMLRAYTLTILLNRS
jgi:hypothetical protein